MRQAVDGRNVQPVRPPNFSLPPSELPQPKDELSDQCPVRHLSYTGHARAHGRRSRVLALDYWELGSGVQRSRTHRIAVLVRCVVVVDAFSSHFHYGDESPTTIFDS